MSLKADKDGVVKIKIHTWRCPREVKGLDNSDMIIQHQDFAYDPDTRGLKIIDTDKEDREAYIQSFADDCGVYNVLKKYSRTGDVSLLHARDGFYADMTSLPVDELDPAAAARAAEQAVSGLNDKLGLDLTSAQLSKMSSQEINDLISKALQVVASKATDEVKKEGE